MSGNNKLLVNYQQQSFVLYDYAKMRSGVGAQSCSYQAFAVIAFQWCFRGDHMTWNGLTEQKNELNRFNNELVSSYPGCRRLFMRGFWFRSSSPSHVKKTSGTQLGSLQYHHAMYTQSSTSLGHSVKPASVKVQVKTIQTEIKTN